MRSMHNSLSGLSLSWSILTALPITALLLVGGCASFNGADLIAGQSRTAEVESSMGQPAEKLTDSNGDQVWFYPQIAARLTYAVRIDKGGVVRGVEQRLTTENLARLSVGKSTTAEARVLFGPPNNVRHFPRTQRTFWEYRMLENDQSFANSSFRLMSLEFSPDNVLRQTYLQEDFIDLSVGCTLC